MTGGAIDWWSPIPRLRSVVVVRRRNDAARRLVMSAIRLRSYYNLSKVGFVSIARPSPLAATLLR